MTNAITVAAGDRHSIALTSDGTIVGWGYNGHGQITPPAGLTDVVAIDACGNYNLALNSDGTVVAWGSNTTGQTDVPVGLTNVVAIAAGRFHALALKSDGTVVGWGLNANGQATAPAGLTNVIAIAAGSSHSLVLKSDGTVVAWGYNFSGQANVPSGLSNVIAITAGSNHSVAAYSTLTNSAPTALNLNPSTVAENSPVGTTVGSFMTADPDTTDEHTYELVTGTGDADNAAFIISNSTLQTNATFDFETKSTYSIRVRTTDSGGLTFEQPISIFATDVNEAPVAVDDTYVTAEDTPWAVIEPGVLINDSDPEGNALIAALLDGPDHGILMFGNDGSFTYTPNANYSGPDSFSYVASDGTVSSNVAFVSLTVNPVNDPSTVDAGGPYTVNEGGSVAVSATAQDIDSGPLTFDWDLDDNGSFETAGQAVVFSAAGIDGPSTRTITVRVTDSDNQTATDTASVAIANVAPTVTLFAPFNAMTGQLIPLGVDASDPGPDTLTTTFNCGEGTLIGDHQCLFSQGGDYQVSVSVDDGDGGSVIRQQIIRIYDYESFCVGKWSGALRMAARGDCNRSETLIELPLPQYASLSLCVNTWSGYTRMSEECGRSERLVSTHGQDTIAVCVNRWTGALRISESCNRSEIADWL